MRENEKKHTMTKKLVAITVLFMMWVSAFSQDYTVEGNSIVITKVIENTNLNIDQESEVILTYLGKAYNDINTTLKTNTTHNIVIKGIYPKVVSFNMGLWKVDLGHQIVVSLKEGRVRVEVSVSKVILWSSEASEEHVITEYYPLNPQMSMLTSSMSKAKTEEMITNAVMLMNKTILEIEDALRSHHEDDNW